MSFIIKTAKTVEEAIDAGLLELGLSRDEVEIEVIEEAKAGFLGFGQKDAMVKLKQKEDISSFVRDILYDKPKEEKDLPKKEEVKKPVENLPKKEKLVKNDSKKEEIIVESVEKFETEKEEVKEEKVVEEVRKEVKKDLVYEEDFDDDEDVVEERGFSRRNRSVESLWNDIELKNKSEEFLSTIIDEFQIDYFLVTEFENNELKVEVKGKNSNDLGIVIGKHGSTLDSLQYLLSQVVNKHKEDFIRVTVDANEYRDKRKKSLEKMARRGVERLNKFNRPVKLEPMNPADRRIVHMVLQNYDDISTHSEGRDPFRRVVITKERKH